MIRFLGGVPFAIILIALTALFVIGGTLLESHADSHLFAAHFTYDNPLFTGLLALFFVNILVSALRRWPFQARHIPFLTTHLGLLMLLLGVMIKNVFGVQGSMAISEGQQSNQVILPNTYAINMPYKTIGLHSDVLWQTWIKQDQLCLNGLSPLPLEEPTLVRLHGLNEEPTKIIATKIKSGKALYQEGLTASLINRRTKERIDVVETSIDLMQSKMQLKGNNQVVEVDLKTLETIGASPFAADIAREPLVAFVQNDKQDIIMYAFDAHGRVHQEFFPHDRWVSVLVYEHGYAAHARIPFSTSTPSRAEAEKNQLITLLNQARSPLAPPLEMLKTACNEQSLNFGETLYSFLTYGSSLPEMRWAPEDLKKARWIAQLAHTDIKKIGWPLAFKNIHELAQQIYAAADHLPDPGPFGTSSDLFSAFLLPYEINLAEMVPALPSFDKAIATLETMMLPRYTVKEPPQKWEDRRPLIEVEVEGKPVLLRYDPFQTELTGPHHLSYRSKTLSIPHTVFVHEAREISYANSSQPYSYECDVLVDGVKTTLSMNRVYETSDGYRFYLAAMTGGNTKQVRIIVNKDPAKYLLTYPGALVLTLGIGLLYLFRVRRDNEPV